MAAEALPAGIRRRRNLKQTGPLCTPLPTAQDAAEPLVAHPSRAPVAEVGQPTHPGRPPCPVHLIQRLKSPARATRWEAALSLTRAVAVAHPDDDPSWGRARKLTVLILHDLLTWFGPGDLTLARRAARWYVRLLEAEPARARDGLREALLRVEEQTGDLHAHGSPAQYADRGQVAVLQARIGHYQPLVSELQALLAPLDQRLHAEAARAAAREAQVGWVDRFKRWLGA